MLDGYTIVTISGSSDQEDNKTKSHGGAGKSKADAPTDLLLHIVYEYEGEYQPAVHPKEPPVEEGASFPTLGRILFVELVRSEGLHGWFIRSLSQCDEIYREEEEAGLEFTCGANLAVGAKLGDCRR